MGIGFASAAFGAAFGASSIGRLGTAPADGASKIGAVGFGMDCDSGDWFTLGWTLAGGFGATLAEGCSAIGFGAILTDGASADGIGASLEDGADWARASGFG
ncbi:hypothetical protein XYCOK13_37850 [Xylanibacillus composti]|uniref:Uncharacterized protein n=1 Tax=Xylanibacillus composti TaxID=1572762 RepID=A0A8J4H6U8_9BACL|nr:hypothetical protein XYCOK13_37850 [Xylanibacillus composti]